MKLPGFLTALLLLITAIPSFAQTPRAIETDLLRSFKRIDHWDQNRSPEGAEDSLEKANSVFSRQLQAYTTTYPLTINQPFKLLKKAGLKIITSPDGLFRIYCWDTSLGGTMRKYKSLAQYKSGVAAKSMFIIRDKGGYDGFYSNLYTIKTSAKTYYLGINIGILSSAYITQGVQIFAIEKGGLDQNAKLIKTTSGLQNRLDVDSDLSARINSDLNTQPQLTFDPKTRTIQLPLITGEGRITQKFITYKFTGQYFEKVK